MLRATAACYFSTSKLQKVARTRQFLWILTWKCASRHSGVQFFDIRTFKKLLRSWGVLYILTSKCGALCILTCKCASRHSGVRFFISLLNNYLRTRLSSEPTFRTSGTTNHRKNTAIRHLPNIWRMCIFFLRTCLLYFSSLLFKCPYCRKLDF